MDYVEEFKNLRSNNKWGRRSPQKAVLMLAVIDMYEQSILTENEVYYDNKLKSLYLKLWNKVLPEEPLFHPDAYLPFWYLQSNNFWHIVPKRGQEDILSLMRDNNAKPSEIKLYDSVKYAELDDDLYFMMTIPSGRSSLKRALLETYFDLTEKQVEKLSESKDNAVDYSASALSEYEKILSKVKDDVKKEFVATDNELVNQFNNLNEDLQIVLNIHYYSFLKSHRSEREIFKEVCPSVYVFLDKIVNHPVKRGEISPSFAFTYDNFLSDLKISLMSEDDSMELIDKITEAIDVLRGNTISESLKNEETEKIGPEPQPEEIEFNDKIDNSSNDEESLPSFIPERDFVTENRKGTPWTENEEELISLYFEQGYSFSTIAALVGRTEVSIKTRLAKLGLIEYTYGQDENSKDNLRNGEIDITQDYRIENTLVKCSIFDKNGHKIFQDDGKLKFIQGKLYRFNLKSKVFTVKDMKLEGTIWIKNKKKIVADNRSALYRVIDMAVDYIDNVEDIVDKESFLDCQIKVNGEWFNYLGEPVSNLQEDSEDKLISRFDSSYTDIFVPKGKLKSIFKIATTSYDFLLVMAITEFMQFTPQPSIITFDKAACMMIAIAWEILNLDGEVKHKEEDLLQCIKFLIEESKEEMDDKLSWNSTRKEVFNAIKDYPMSGAFEDTVDLLLENAPWEVLRAWIQEEDDAQLSSRSNDDSTACLYAIHPMKRDPYFEVKTGWKRYLYTEHDSLIKYYTNQYLEFLANC